MAEESEKAVDTVKSAEQGGKEDEREMRETSAQEELQDPADEKDESKETKKDGEDSKQRQEQEKTKSMSKEAKRLRSVFARPSGAEPRHPIFSSLFCRHISAEAFGPRKPKWFKALTTAELYLFKDIMSYVEVGRESVFRFDDFLEALQDFDPSLTREEVVDVLDSMEKNEFEELDFGKFLFLLAYRDRQADPDNADDVEEKLSSPVVTPRQSLILSAIAYFVLIASPEEIERYYIQNTRRKSTVLHRHLEATRLQGLTDRQMEVKQRKAREELLPLFAATGSPYAAPVPFVPRFRNTKIYKEMTKRRLTSAKSAMPFAKKPIARPIKPIKMKREFGDKIGNKTEEDEIYDQMNYGRIPMPQMKMPAEVLKEMRTKCTVELKDYITEKAYEAVKEYKERLRQATVLYGRRNLRRILRQNFPTKAEEDAFIELFQRYFPLEIEDVKDFSLWVRPAGYRVCHTGKPLYPDKFAFGTKIP